MIQISMDGVCIMKILKNIILPAVLGQLTAILVMIICGLLLLKSDEPSEFYLPLAHLSSIFGALVCGSIVGFKTEGIFSKLLPSILMCLLTLLLSLFPGESNSGIVGIILPLMQFFLSFGGAVLLEHLKKNSSTSSRRRNRAR